MKRRLYIKILLCYLLFGIAALIIVYTATPRIAVRYLFRQNQAEMNRECSLLASEYRESYLESSISLDDLQTHFASMSDYLNLEIWIVDSKGRLLIDSSDASVSQNATRQEYTAIPGFNISDFGNNYYQTGDFYGQFSEEYLTVFSPVTNNYQTLGYVLLHKPLSAITAQADSLMDITFFTVALLFVCTFFILVIYVFIIYIPLRRITTAARQYSTGDFSKRINVHSRDEIGYLASTLNYMANELDTREEDQRKFISNVSHDFRSPLTSIKGYLEAILDGTVPGEMQEKYLRIILFETERLNKLTQSLLDLNRFGGHGIMLDMTDFDVNNVIKTTIMTFEGACHRKGLSFDLVLTGQKLFVYGDVTKIQQVLYNLIDNAVKFSYNGTAIKIETHIKNEKVLISVKDSGIGIPGDCTGKIWERFYKTDLSRGKDKRGTGLGLSIVKEIIQAHNEHINVISTEGVGSEFIFTLPLSRHETNR